MYESSSINYVQELQKIMDEFQFDFIALALVQPAELRHVLKWEYILGNKSERYRRIVLQSGKGIAGNVFKTGKPFLVSNVAHSLKEDLYNYPIVTAESLTSFGAIPLFKYNRVEGVLLAAFREKNAVTEELFEKIKDAIGPRFGPYYNEEMVKE